MNIIIRDEFGTGGSHYTPKELTSEARAIAKGATLTDEHGKARYVRHWVEVTGARVSLRVEVKYADGIGNIISCAI